MEPIRTQCHDQRIQGKGIDLGAQLIQKQGESARHADSPCRVGETTEIRLFSGVSGKIGRHIGPFTTAIAHFEPPHNRLTIAPHSVRL